VPEHGQCALRAGSSEAAEGAQKLHHRWQVELVAAITAFAEPLEVERQRDGIRARRPLIALSFLGGQSLVVVVCAATLKMWKINPFSPGQAAAGSRKQSGDTPTIAPRKPTGSPCSSGPEGAANLTWPLGPE
jgi:hypothetical protein